MKSYLSLLICLLWVVSLTSAQNAAKLKGKYLGQEPPGKVPELFAPGIISTKHYEHSAPAFSPDGNTVLWTVIYERGKPARMLEMQQLNGTWTEPASPSFADLTTDDFYPTFSVDGKKLYFSSRRKVPAGYKDAGLRIWEVEKTQNGWGKPVPFDTVVSRGEDYALSMTRNGSAYFAIRRQNGRVFDIVTCQKQNNQYVRPETLPYNINTTASEDGAFIAPDESYLIFESARPGSIEGSTDLYISFRKKGGSWGRAINMGPEINSKFTERFPKLSPDGKYLFFGSDRNLMPGAEGTDVYWVDARVIEDLKAADSNKESAIDQDGKEILAALYGNDFAKNASLLKQWLQRHPFDEDAFVSYISSLRRSKQITEAEREIKAKETKLPTSIDMKMEVALVMYEMNQGEEAEKYVLSQLSPVPQQRFHYTQLANQLYQMKKYAESAAIYDAALKIQPGGPEYYNMACSWSLAGNKDKAFEALHNAADQGYTARNNFETDADLDLLKSDSRWTAFMQKLDVPFNGATPYKRAHHELVYDNITKSVLMMGGSTPLNGGQAFKFFNDIWANNKSGWRKVGNAGDERSGIRLAFDSRRNKLLCYGGFTGNNQSSGQLRAYENGEWKVLSDIPEMKAAEPGFVYDVARDKFIAFGGTAGRGLVNGAVWEWDGSVWKKFEGVMPPARQAFAMVYDSKRKRTIIFGGSAAGPDQSFGDTWEFDGNEWKKISEDGPGPRMTMGYAYDSKNEMMIIFGGLGANGVLGDTWGWNGKEWKQLSGDGPSPRMMGYMAYDQERERVVMFGGRLGWPNDAGDTWEWDGKEWEESNKYD